MRTRVRICVCDVVENGQGDLSSNPDEAILHSA